MHPASKKHPPAPLVQYSKFAAKSPPSLVHTAKSVILFMHLPVILNDGAKLCPATLPTTKRARRNFMKMLKLYPVTENVSTLPTRRRARMDEEDLTSPEVGEKVRS